MKENKKVSPSLGIGSPYCVAAKSILLFSFGRKNLFGLRVLLVVLLGVFGIGNAWASGLYDTYLRTSSADAAPLFLCI